MNSKICFYLNTSFEKMCRHKEHEIIAWYILRIYKNTFIFYSIIPRFFQRQNANKHHAIKFVLYFNPLFIYMLLFSPPAHMEEFCKLQRLFQYAGFAVCVAVCVYKFVQAKEEEKEKRNDDIVIFYGSKQSILLLFTKLHSLANSSLSKFFRV